MDIDHGADWCNTPGDPGQLVDECCDEGSLIFQDVEDVKLVEGIH